MHSIKSQINFTYERKGKSSLISNDGVSMNASHTASYRVTLRILFEKHEASEREEKSPLPVGFLFGGWLSAEEKEEIGKSSHGSQPPARSY